MRTRRMADLLYRDRSERFRSAQAIVNAKIPIVRMKDRVSGIKCDLNTASRMGVMNSAYVRLCADSDPRARRLMMLVKLFASRHDLSGSGRGNHFSSYSVVMLVIFFLQTQGILHPLHLLQEVPGLQKTEISGLNFAFCRDPSLLPSLQPNRSSLVELLQGFFLYYSQFTFGNQVTPFCIVTINTAAQQHHTKATPQQYYTSALLHLNNTTQLHLNTFTSQHSHTTIQ